jgi:nitroimidazol reductase NimA-like FMN-containing flavoprotein (pyridoxamine 5'-phosphate oxidase superfamily)
MSQNELLKEALDYAQKTRFATLNYVREDNAPVSRAMGSFAFDGTKVVFSSQKSAAKVAAIKSKNRISFFFEHEGQELATWKSALAIGSAELVENEKEKNRLAGILADRNPRFKERIEKNELDQVAIFLLKTDELQYIDRSKGPSGNTTISIEK